MLRTENNNQEQFQLSSVRQNDYISQQTPIKTLDEQKILREQLNELYRNLQGSYGDYRNKLIRVLNYTQDEQFEQPNKTINMEQNMNKNKLNRVSQGNKHMRSHTDVNRKQVVGDSPADKYVEAISKRIIEQRKAYREKQRGLQNHFLGVQLGMHEYKRAEIDKKSKQKQREQQRLQSMNNPKTHTRNIKQKGGETGSNLAAGKQYGEWQQIRLTLNPNDNSFRREQKAHPIYVQPQEGSQRTYQQVHGKYDQQHLQTFRKLNEKEQEYPKFKYEQPSSSNRSAFDKYRVREGLRANAAFVQTQDEMMDYQINPITMVKQHNAYEQQGRGYQIQANMHNKKTNATRFFKNTEESSRASPYLQRYQQQQRPAIKSKEKQILYDTSSESNYYTITDGEISSQLRSDANKNRVKFNDDHNDGNMSQKMHYRKNLSPHSRYPDVVAQNQGTKSKNNYVVNKQLYDQIRSMRLGQSHVQDIRKQKEYNSFLLTQQKVLEDQKNKSRILIDQAHSVIQDNSSPYSNDYYQSVMKKQQVNYSFDYKSVSPIKVLQKNLKSNRFDSPSSITVNQQVHHRYDEEAFCHRNQKQFQSNQNQKFHRSEYKFYESGKGKEYQEPLHDYQHNFQSYLRYFLNEVVDLFMISELLKYHLKHKSYEMLTKLFTFAYPKNTQSSMSKSKSIGVKEIDLKKTIKLADFQVLVSRMLGEFKKSQIDYVCRNIFTDRNEISFDQFQQALSSGLSDHQAQQLSSSILNLHNTRTSDLMKRLFLTWTELRYFEKRIKDLLKSQPQKMQEFVQQITVDNLLNSEMLLEYLRHGDQGIKIRNRKLRVDIYLNRIMGRTHKQANFLIWIYQIE